MKPGELERSLSRLVEMARTARERLAAIELQVAELRREMEWLAAQSADPVQPTVPQDTTSAAAEARSREPEPASAPGEGHGTPRLDQAARVEADHSGREAGSE